MFDELTKSEALFANEQKREIERWLEILIFQVMLDEVSNSQGLIRNDIKW